MQRLKTLLKSKFFFFFLCLCALLCFFYKLAHPQESIYLKTDTRFIGRVEKISIEKEKLNLTISSKGELLSGFMNKNTENLNLEIHDFVIVQGTLNEITPNTNFYSFNYREYAKRHRQFYSIDINNIKILEKNTNIFYQMKNYFKKKIEKFSSSAYLAAFLLGDTSLIREEVMENLRDQGVSHLFAISGMHVSFLMGLFSLCFEKLYVSLKKQLIFYIGFLSLYVFLVGFSPSVLRASLFFVLLKLNKIYQWNIKPIYLLVLIFLLLIAINPYYLWEVGFQYSFAISFVLVLSSSFLKKKKNYWLTLLSTSYLAFLASIPIGVFHFHQIQLFSTIYNLFFVPFVSFLLFPLSFLTFLIPPLEGIYLFLIEILEKASFILANFQSSVWTMRHPNFLAMIYLIILIISTLFFVFKNKKIHVIILALGLVFYHYSNVFIKEDYMTMLDVGQGDAILLSSKGKTILVDTGGSIYKDLAKSTLIPYFKAKGILKLDYLVLTHGDYDHLGAAQSLLKKFPVKKVLFNANDWNKSEKALISYLEKKQISYEKVTHKTSFTLGNLKFQGFSLANKDENDASIVLYGEIFDISFLLMGDASIFTEKELIKRYNIPKVDILKVGHHGSKTSTEEKFLEQIKPKVALISAGRNNRFSHPHSEVIEKLEKFFIEIYSTKKQGSIFINFRKKGNIFTVIP